MSGASHGSAVSPFKQPKAVFAVAFACVVSFMGIVTVLAAREGVTQPAMTQLISRLEESGLVRREASQEDGRVVLVVITDEGRAMLERRRSVRTARLAGIIAQLSPEHHAALADALPALDALASVPRDDDLARVPGR